MAHIFISYSRKDSDFARYLRAILENANFTVWMDEKRLSAGMNWSDELESAIDNCGAFIVIMSPDSHESRFVQSEVLHALDRNKAIFPVLLVGEPFFLLKAYQYEDMRRGLSASISPAFINNLKQAMGIETKSPQPTRLEIVEGNVLSFACDVLVLKYSSAFRGADLQVAAAFAGQGDPIDQVTLRQGNYVLRSTDGLLAPQHVLYIPTARPKDFTYSEIRTFTENAFSILATQNIGAKHIAMTLHGMGFGLDEHEALMAQIGGIIDVLQSDNLDLDIERISIVEFSSRRAPRLQKSATPFLDEASYAQRVENMEWAYDLLFESQSPIVIPDAGQSDIKPYALAITSDDEALEDIFYYGIERPTHSMGLLCERITLGESQQDESLSTKLERIALATAVICDVSQISPLLYLQVGYALGKGIPTVLISQSEQADLDAARTIAYQKIWELEERLSQWLKETIT